MAPVETLEPEPESPRRDSTSEAGFNLHTNILGAAQWGLPLTFEGGSKISGYLRLRPLNTGLLNYLMLTRDEEDRFVWGLGGTTGIHFFSADDGNMRGWFGGVALGYFFAKNEDTKLDFARYLTHALVPQADFGYRWAFRHFLLGVGIRFGVSFAVSARDEPIGGFGCTFVDSCPEDRRIVPLPELVVDLGAFLPD